MDMGIESNSEEFDLAAGVVAVNLSEERKATLRAQWKNALIVKVFGKIVGYQFLYSRIMSLSKPGGKLNYIALGNDFFQIQFSLKEDYTIVLKGGPWFIGGHYLSIRNWEPNSKASITFVSSVVVWVRLPELPVEYYEPSIFWEIGTAIGPVLQIDTHTAAESQARFAHIYIQVDFDKPLIKLVKIGGIEQPVQYEGINSLCFSYGRVGHKGKSCPYMAKSPVKENVDVGEDANHVSQTQDFPTKDLYGPWVLVTRKRNDSRKLRKDIAQTFPSSSAPNTRAQSPTPISSPSKIGFDYTGLVESDRTIDSKSPSPIGDIVTNCTISTKESTKPNSMSARGARAKHQSRNTLGVKGSRQSQNTSVSTNRTKSSKSNPPPPKQYVSILSKLLLTQG